MNITQSLGRLNVSEEPEDLLVKRLILRDQQVAEYRDMIDLCTSNMRTLISIIEGMAEALPEPEVMRDVANYVDYPLYKEYLVQCSNLFEYYKANIVLTKGYNK